MIGWVCHGRTTQQDIVERNEMFIGILIFFGVLSVFRRSERSDGLQNLVPRHAGTMTPVDKNYFQKY
jgi:hypothetical protein